MCKISKHKFKLNCEILINIYQSFSNLSEIKHFGHLESTLIDLHKNYNKINPYSMRVLIGEIAIKIPNNLINYYADYIYKKLNISIINLELYLENRIKMLISQDGLSWQDSTKKMLNNQAIDLFQKSLILDQKYQNNQTKYQLSNWPNIVVLT